MPVPRRMYERRKHIGDNDSPRRFKISCPVSAPQPVINRLLTYLVELRRDWNDSDSILPPACYCIDNIDIGLPFTVKHCTTKVPRELPVFLAYGHARELGQLASQLWHFYSPWTAGSVEGQRSWIFILQSSPGIVFMCFPIEEKIKFFVVETRRILKNTNLGRIGRED